MLIDEVIEKALNTHKLTKEEIIYLLEQGGTKLHNSADEVRKQFKGRDVHLRGLIEFTNICKNDCYYCGLRSSNKKVERYRLSVKEIIGTAEKAVQVGYKTIVLQGGEDIYYDADKICEIVKEIKKYGVAITLSIGERTIEEYKAFKEAGADRYLMRIETSDKNLYKSLHPNMSYENRINILYELKKMGYETGTGSIVGLPEQTIESLAEDILFYKKLNADMIGIGPLIPHPETPLRDAKRDNFDMALNVMAVTRLILPDINIPATTAMESIRRDGRIKALQSGANVVMPNITEGENRRKYELYPNKICINESGEKCMECISRKIKSINRTIGATKGFRNENNNSKNELK